MPKILIIEPDHVLAKTYKTALENAGYKVSTSTNAQDAINEVDSNEPDLIIVEIQLVSHSGIEFLYEFRSYKEWQKVPVLILSMVPMQEFSDNWELLSKELNIASYLYKPSVKLGQLIKEVEKILNDK
jgi:DNA-binding response OmpR family regulator